MDHCAPSRDALANATDPPIDQFRPDLGHRLSTLMNRRRHRDAGAEIPRERVVSRLALVARTSFDIDWF